MATPDEANRGRTQMVFAIDVVGYSSRVTVDQIDAQQRLDYLIIEVLKRIGLPISDTVRQGTGDGIIVFLPPTVDPRQVLARLTMATAELLDLSNARYHDRLRLRMAGVLGTLSPTALGFTGNVVVECALLVDSEVLRRAMAEEPGADIAVILSDELHTHFDSSLIGGRIPIFQPVEVRVKDYHRRAWLWVAHGSEVSIGRLRDLVADRTMVLGSNHPDTLSSRHSLAQWIGEAGDPAEAERLLQELVADRTMVLGSDHPETLASRQGLAERLGQVRGGKPSVFISYSRADADFAHSLAMQLQGDGFDVFLDTELGVAQSFQATLVNAIRRADVLLALVSPESLASQWCQAELEFALKAGKRILPILLRGEPGGRLANYQHLDSLNLLAELPNYLTQTGG